MSLAELLERVERTPFPEWGLSNAVANLFNFDAPVYMDYTQSVSCAIALCEREFPHAMWEVCKDNTACVRIDDVDYVCWKASTPALALCAAIIKAMIAKQERAA